ncbi:MAG: ATP-binding protein [Anaerolineae bacterium]
MLGNVLDKLPVPTPQKGSEEEARAQRTQAVCPICKGLGYVRLDLPVGHPDFGKLFPCVCREAEFQARKVAQLLRASDLSLLSHMTFETFNPEGRGMLLPDQRQSLEIAYRTALTFAEHPEGWLLLEGGYGCGKTHLAAAIANHCLARGQVALFVVVPDLLDHLRATFAPGSTITFDEQFEAVRTVPVLILDDLGTQSSSPWAQEKLYQLINYRYNARLPTVVTTNQPIAEMDPRIRSRLVDSELTAHVIIRAPDYRRPYDAHRSELSSLHLLGDLTFDTFDARRRDLPARQRELLQDAFRVAQQYAEAPEGWLLLRGPYHAGKTHLAAAIANHLAQRGHRVLFIMVPDLLDHLRATFNPANPARYDKRFDEVRNVPFLVLDDLGTESATDWAREKLNQLFTHRYHARLPTVITASAQEAKIDERLRRRLEDETLCRVVELTVAPYKSRRAAGKAGPRAGQLD